MKPRIRFSLGILTAGFIALLSASLIWAQDNSHTRVLRLSFVEGEVTVQRPDVQTWAEAPVNTPIQEGSKLSTAENSFAEIQFENGGTIRLGQLSTLEFTALGLEPNGAEINHVELHQGYATFHPLPSGVGESFQVGTPYGTLTAEGGTQFRVDLDQGVERVEVFAGAVEERSNMGAMTLEENFTLVMQPGTSEPTDISQGITEDDWDKWVDDREAQMEMPPTGPSPNTYSSDEGEDTYGWSDLLQYGTWSNVPGAGYGWTPSMVTDRWAPYSTGQWCWYPGWGYTWIGAEPWGWLPYHYGGWEFITGTGWVWFPGRLHGWSPSQVAWYHGPNWVGWIPRSHRHGDSNGCGKHCGGGVVSTSTFRHGGALTANVMLRINPTLGEQVKEPGIAPSATAKLTGPAISTPPALRQGSIGSTAHAAPMGRGLPATTAASPGWQHVGARHPSSSIVYDPQHNSYVNSHRSAPPQVRADAAGEANTTGSPGTNPGLIRPVPVENREAGERPADNQGRGQPDPMIGPGPMQPRPVGGRTGAAPRGSTNTYTTPANQELNQPNPPMGANPIRPAPAGQHTGATPGSNNTVFANPPNHGNPSGRPTPSGTSGNPGGGRQGGGGGSPAGGHSGSASSGGHAGAASAGGGHH